MCCTRLAANAGPKKVAKNRHLGTIPQLCRAISSQLRHVSTIRKKNLLSSNISPTCPHSMVNFGPLAAEIVSLVWGDPGNFNGFRVLAALLHGTIVVGVSQTAALNRERHLYSAGRPSRWALAHISSLFSFYKLEAIILKCMNKCLYDVLNVDVIKNIQFISSDTSSPYNRTKSFYMVSGKFILVHNSTKITLFNKSLPMGICRPNM